MVLRISKELGAMLLASALACTGRAPSHSSEPPTEAPSKAIAQAPPTTDVAPKADAPKAAPPNMAHDVAHDVAPVAPAYPLDFTSRKVPMTGKVTCPPVQLVNYSGDIVAFHKPARINEDFAQHMRRFEEIVRNTAIEIYGRAPARITRMGSFYCRRIRAWPYLISEHGLGNAVDVGGFEFARVSGEAAKDVPAHRRRRFEVTMSKHWRASTERDADHQVFLRLLAKRIIDEDDLFRVILGPADPKHKDHFHFDMSPNRIVNVFD
tara:strand:- start:22424 stop:23218 length:795 start_codon:yes stop_codon:yes gene_type:complete